MKATQQLRDEHEGIKVMLNILEQIGRDLEMDGPLNGEHVEGILEFLTIFVDKCHHAKEEELLFPVLVAAGVPREGHIALLLEEHERGRSYVQAIRDAYTAWSGGVTPSAQAIRQNALTYIALLREHIEKENNVLFVMADSILSEITQDELLEGFEKIEEERIGVGKHESFHHFLKELGKVYLKGN